MDAVSRFIVPGIVFLLALPAGLLLSRAGRPYNGIVFNIHKLIALAAVILTAVQANNELKLAGAQAGLTALLLLAGACVVTLFASGAVMSMGKGSQAMLLNIHKTAIVVAVIIWPLALLVLAGRIP